MFIIFGDVEVLSDLKRDISINVWKLNVDWDGLRNESVVRRK